MTTPEETEEINAVAAAIQIVIHGVKASVAGPAVAMVMGDLLAAMAQRRGRRVANHLLVGTMDQITAYLDSFEEADNDA